MDAKRFAYCATLVASALWIGTAARLSTSPSNPVVAESPPVVAGVKGHLGERLEAWSAQTEAKAEVSENETEVLGAVEVAQSQFERTSKQLSKQIVEAAPPAPEPLSPSPALLQVSVSSGPVEAGIGLDGSGVAQANLNANLGWLSFP